MKWDGMGRRIWKCLLLRRMESRHMERHAGRRRCTEDRRQTGRRDGTGMKVSLQLRDRGRRRRADRRNRRFTPAVLPSLRAAEVRWERQTRAAVLQATAGPGARLPVRSRPENIEMQMPSRYGEGIFA